MPCAFMYVVIIEFFLQNTKILSSLGYDLVIGVALIKIARVYYIFKNPSANKKVINMDYYCHFCMADLLL